MILCYIISYNIGQNKCIVYLVWVMINFIFYEQLNLNILSNIPYLNALQIVFIYFIKYFKFFN